MVSPARAARLRAGLSARCVAKRLGIRPDAVLRAERVGTYYERAAMLASVVGCRAELYLWGRETPEGYDTAEEMIEAEGVRANGDGDTRGEAATSPRGDDDEWVDLLTWIGMAEKGTDDDGQHGECGEPGV